MAQITKVEILLDGVLHQTLTTPPFDRVDTASLSPGTYQLTGNVFIDGALHHTIPARNFTVVEPFALDPDYQAVLDYASANAIQAPTYSEQLIDNQRMLDYKSSGLYAKADVLLNLEDGAPLPFRQIDWKRKIRVTEITSAGASSLTVDGVRPEGGQYWDLLYNPATDGVNYTLNDAGVCYYLTQNVASGTSFTFGVIDGNNQLGVMGNRPTGDNVYSINAVNTLASPKQVIGMNGLHRSAGTGVDSSKFIANGVTTPFSVDAVGLPNRTLYLFARNNEGVADLKGSPRMRFFALGANMEAEQAAIKTILEA